MGRGRAKAKQIKVARKLKYSAPSTDLSALEKELHASRGGAYESFASPDDDDDDEGEDVDDDPYASYVEDDAPDDFGNWAAGGSR